MEVTKTRLSQDVGGLDATISFAISMQFCLFVCLFLYSSYLHTLDILFGHCDKMRQGEYGR